MKLKPIEKRWWFFTPVTVATVYSIFWMFSALGLDTTFTPFWSPRTLLFVILFYSFERFYSFALQMVLAWLWPTAIDEKKLAS